MKIFLTCAALLLSFLSFLDVGAQNQLSVSIQSPRSGDIVEARHWVIGRVSNPNADVWVVVRPMAPQDFWVQPPVAPGEDGTWKVLVYFGEAGSRHSGTQFEVRAFANPVGRISVGRTNQWPRAAARSHVVEVIRR